MQGRVFIQHYTIKSCESQASPPLPLLKGIHKLEKLMQSCPGKEVLEPSVMYTFPADLLAQSDKLAPNMLFVDLADNLHVSE